VLHLAKSPLSYALSRFMFEAAHAPYRQRLPKEEETQLVLLRTWMHEYVDHVTAVCGALAGQELVELCFACGDSVVELGRGLGLPETLLNTSHVARLIGLRKNSNGHDGQSEYRRQRYTTLLAHTPLWVGGERNVRLNATARVSCASARP
jgi:hypothetical protein